MTHSTDIAVSVGDIVQVKSTVLGKYAGCAGTVQRIQNNHYQVSEFAVLKMPDGEHLAFEFHEITQVV